MKFKKTAIALGIALCAGAYLPAAVGGGIPVVDGSHIAATIGNQVETIAKWVQQFEQMKAQISKAEETLKALQGASNKGNLLNSVAKMPLPKEVSQLLGNFKSMPAFSSERAKYPVLEGAPKANEMFDAIAGQNATFQHLYSENAKRIENIEALMGAIDAAKDPGDKLDLANRLQIEQSTVSSNMNLIQLYEKLSQSQIEQAGQAAEREFGCQQFKKTDC